MTERQLQDAVLELARTFRWLVYHTFDSRNSTRGFPDLCMVRGSRLVFAELKREGKSPTVEQVRWLTALGNTERRELVHVQLPTGTGTKSERVGGPEVYVWRPADWTSGEVERVLR